jgi:hypothetical protein
MRAIADSLSLSFHIRSEKFRFSETGFWHQLGRATFREARLSGPILTKLRRAAHSDRSMPGRAIPTLVVVLQQQTPDG